MSDNKRGISRQKRRRSFAYLHPSGKTVTDEETLLRIRKLAIPPAWTDVWICPAADGHLQATGRDARGRKQYRYHPKWNETRDGAKFERMLSFARSLSRLRRRVERDLKSAGLHREKVLAAVVSLLEKSLIRVGNDEYASSNGSYGLTTLLDRHARISRGAVRFVFRGKSGKVHDVEVPDARLAAIVKKCQDLPGQELLQYVDEGGRVRDVTSSDVNAYLREITGENFTAKDFRTWGGTVLAAIALQQFQKFDSKAQAKKNILAAIERVAKRLGNTPTICRKCYIHPEVFNAYMDQADLDAASQAAEKELRVKRPRLPPEEGAVLVLLERRLSQSGGKK